MKDKEKTDLEVIEQLLEHLIYVKQMLGHILDISTQPQQEMTIGMHICARGQIIQQLFAEVNQSRHKEQLDNAVKKFNEFNEAMTHLPKKGDDYFG